MKDIDGGMETITFIDLEVTYDGKIVDIGCLTDSGHTLRTSNIIDLDDVLKRTSYLVGHNLLNHDSAFIRSALTRHNISHDRIFDTLHISPLVFPTRPYHALLKDEKLLSEELNNPVSDAKKAQTLFADEISAFSRLPSELKDLFYLLLHNQKHFKGFFNYVRHQCSDNAAKLIVDYYGSEICTNGDIQRMIDNRPIELAYCLANISATDRFSVLPAWVLKTYPDTANVMHILRSTICDRGCSYCDRAFDPIRGLQEHFGFSSYRTFDEKPLQEMAVRDALLGKSLLVVFPTGGGKSITFQVPALMNGVHEKGLTIVISPLVSLMKDQVDNLERKDITEAGTINSTMNPIERSNTIERIKDGSISILYISPEMLRSRTLENLLLKRVISRFVIDEAHCLSAWGQDFRVDYLYIATFIKNLQIKKGLFQSIPVSCFTATAKPSVIADIRNYFFDNLDLDLVLHQSHAPRKNLTYRIIPCTSKDVKYTELRRLLEEKSCPTIVYVAETKFAEELAKRLTDDSFPAKAYHGRLDRELRLKVQDEFISGDVDVLVATSAFGMGVDKSDVGRVIHYHVSDSPEQYLQEAGRAGRDPSISADCIVLYDDIDLNRHFIRLNQTKINFKEIQQIWRSIKELTRFRKSISVSALEIARKAGWDDSIFEIETRVTAAVAALEDAGYIRRTSNMPRVFADSVLCKTLDEARTAIEKSKLFNEDEIVTAVRIMSNVISNKYRSRINQDEAETRVDYIADNLGIKRYETISVINRLREIKLLGDTKDLLVFFNPAEGLIRSERQLKTHMCVETSLLEIIDYDTTTYSFKETNEKLEEKGCKSTNTKSIKTILTFWKKTKIIDRKIDRSNGDHFHIRLKASRENIAEEINARHELASFIISYLFEAKGEKRKEDQNESDESAHLNSDLSLKIDVKPGTDYIHFSIHDILDAYNRRLDFAKREYTLTDVENTILYLTLIDAMSIEGGFLVIYNPMMIERLEEDNRIQYKKEDYQKLETYYESKTQKIHIVGEYANKMIEDYKEALIFVNDYFSLNYSSFLAKYFSGSRGLEINRNLTPKKFKELFGALSPTQLNIINDKESQYIAVLAGPGSGKTRILVHKLASLVLMEDVKYEQLLMLTFSRAAATEFRLRLQYLIQKAANFIDIKTFHSYCFDLLGRIGSIERSDNVIGLAVESINNGDIELSQITKTVLVIDEAQDMSFDEYSLVRALMDANEDMRVIAVGDDDQNIYEFRGSSSDYFTSFINEKKAAIYDLLTNYRSLVNLVDFSNQFAKRIRKRIKSKPIVSYAKENGIIRLVRYDQNLSSRLITPFVDDFYSQERTGTSCLLTQTNDQALQVTSMLRQLDVPAQLMQGNEGFRLSDLAEMRYFRQLLEGDERQPVIDESDWSESLAKLKRAYQNSRILGQCLSLISNFNRMYPDRKYLSDFESYLYESKLEDFVAGSSEVVHVGTMHKSKGKEYDNVFLMVDQHHRYKAGDEENRVLYVAMTRAKSNLTIHYAGDDFDSIHAEQLIRKSNNTFYPLPTEIIIQAGHKDVFLGFFSSPARQIWLDQARSGDYLTFTREACLAENGYPILRFSKMFREKIDQTLKNGYELGKAYIGYLVYWFNKETEKEYKIALPELHFIKRDSKAVYDASRVKIAD